MKSYTFTLVACLLAATIPAPCRADPGLSASKACRQWFESWAAEAKASLANELKQARVLGMEKRTDPEVFRPIDAIILGAHQLCGRLSSTKPMVVKDGSVAEKCAAQFDDWENDQDNVYASAVFDKHLSADSPDAKEFVPAQDIARREALLGKAFCRLMEKLH